MTKTIVHVMRHGEVDNPQGILYGRRPGFSLTDHGKKMTAAVADHFKQIGADIRAVVASPLLRAQESAAPTAKAYGLPVLNDKRLVEAGNSFEGVAVNANRKSLAQPKYWWRYRNVFEPSWGEPYTEIARRMVAGVAHAKAMADGGEALVVSCQYGRCGVLWKGTGCGTIRANGSALWPHLPHLPLRMTLWWPLPIQSQWATCFRKLPTWSRANPRRSWPRRRPLLLGRAVFVGRASA